MFSFPPFKTTSYFRNILYLKVWTLTVKKPHGTRFGEVIFVLGRRRLEFLLFLTSWICVRHLLVLLPGRKPLSVTERLPSECEHYLSQSRSRGSLSLNLVNICWEWKADWVTVSVEESTWLWQSFRKRPYVRARQIEPFFCVRRSDRFLYSVVYLLCSRSRPVPDLGTHSTARVRRCCWLSAGRIVSPVLQLRGFLKSQHPATARYGRRPSPIPIQEEAESFLWYCSDGTGQQARDEK